MQKNAYYDAGEFRLAAVFFSCFLLLPFYSSSILTKRPVSFLEPNLHRCPTAINSSLFIHTYSQEKSLPLSPLRDGRELRGGGGEDEFLAGREGMAGFVDCSLRNKMCRESDLLERGWSVVIAQRSQKWIVRDIKI